MGSKHKVVKATLTETPDETETNVTRIIHPNLANPICICIKRFDVNFKHFESVLYLYLNGENVH